MKQQESRPKHPEPAPRTQETAETQASNASHVTPLHIGAPPPNPESASARQNAILHMQQTQGNAAVRRMLSKVPRSSVQRSVVGRSGGSATPERSAELQSKMAEYRAAREAGDLSQEQINEVEQSVQNSESAIRQAQTVGDRGSSTMQASAGALAFAGVLAADDVTGIGVADDVAIPFALLAAGALYIAAQARSSSSREVESANRAAREAVSEAVRTIGQVLMAAQAGKQIRGLTHQIVIHLARILGSAVNGQPPDHQNDPKRDRPHWWKEIKNWIQQIKDKNLSPKQLWRELTKEFTPEQLAEIREAIRRAAEMLGEDPPDFPPTAMP